MTPYTPHTLFLHHRPQNLSKKKQKCKKKAKNCFHIAKINMQKNHKIIFQKKMQKKRKNAKKKMQKKHVGCR